MSFSVREMLREQADNWARLGAPAVSERFVLRNGREFEAGKRPKGFRKGKAKECFGNATKLVAYHEGLRYVEGYVVRESLAIPILHAWAIDENDTVIDVTLDRQEECRYMGVVLTRKEVWAEMQKLGHYGLIDTGLGLNVDWMFRLDPGLKDEIDTIKPFNMKKWIEANKEA